MIGHRLLRLILSPKKGLLHSKFKAVEVDEDNVERPVRIDHETFYDGRYAYVVDEIWTTYRYVIVNPTAQTEFTSSVIVPRSESFRQVAEYQIRQFSPELIVWLIYFIKNRRAQAPCACRLLA